MQGPQTPASAGRTKGGRRLVGKIGLNWPKEGQTNTHKSTGDYRPRGEQGQLPCLRLVGPCFVILECAFELSSRALVVTRFNGLALHHYGFAGFATVKKRT